MIQELTDAGQYLQEALDRYFSVCSAVQGYFVQGNRLDSVPQAFSGRVSDELKLVSALETKLKRCKASISGVRNYHTSLVPINVLPPEILIHIFHFVLQEAQPCIRHDTLIFPKYPDVLSHVCSNWRLVALRSCALWSHIDLAPCHSLHHGLLARAAIYATRVGDLPLYIHLMNLEGLGNSDDYTSDGLEQFLASVAPRITSWDLVATGPPECESMNDVATLQSCINNCEPSTLTQLTIRNTLTPIPSFIQSNEAPGEDVGISAGVVFVEQSKEFLEELLQPITVLRLYGLYPYWTSAAYHRLVELRLTFGDDVSETYISESQLVAILNSSPGLRIFQFNHITQSPLSLDALVVPVQLKDLEILDVNIISPAALGHLLRWIAPGLKPLQASFTGPQSMAECLSNNVVKDFFARSNIQKLRLVGGYSSCRDVASLLSQSPNLRVLILEDPIQRYEVAKSEIEQGHNSLPMGFRLGRLCLLGWALRLKDLEWLLGMSPVHTLTLWECGFVFEPSNLASSQSRADEIHEVCAKCSVVEHLKGDKPNLFEVWD